MQRILVTSEPIDIQLPEELVEIPRVRKSARKLLKEMVKTQPVRSKTHTKKQRHQLRKKVAAHNTLTAQEVRLQKQRAALANKRHVSNAPDMPVYTEDNTECTSTTETSTTPSLTSAEGSETEDSKVAQTQT